MKKPRQVKPVFLIVMRIAVLPVLMLLAGATVALAVESKAQESLQKKISLVADKETMESVLGRIEQVADVKFIYSPQVVEVSRRISVQARNEPLGDVLNGLFRPVQVVYEVVGKQIVLRKAATGFLPLEGAAPAAVTVTGRVSDEKGEGLPGVNVLLKGTTTGTTTDADGNYALNVPDAIEGGTLVFSFIGYLTQEVPISNRGTIDVKLASDVKALGEVVVVGYGTQKKRDLTGAVASVNTGQLRGIPLTSPDQALQGRLSGVVVTQNSGAPGAGASVRVRGLGTINNSEPLYVVDGVPVLNNSSGTEGGSGVNTNVLATINPNDIATIDVLKDASAVAIYGSRGANGVVIITTKRGQEGPPKVFFDAYYGGQSAWRKLDLLDSYGYAALSNESNANAGLPPIARLADENVLAQNTDWQSELLRPAPIQNYSLSVSGGSAKATYNVSGGFFDQQGIMVGTDFKRYSFRVNTDFTLSRRLKIGQSLSFTTSRNNRELGGSRTLLEHAFKQAPTIPVYDPGAEGGFAGPTKDDGQDAENPVGVMSLNVNRSDRRRLLGNVYADLSLVDGLTYRLNVGVDDIVGNTNTFTPTYQMGQLRNLRSSVSEFNATETSLLYEHTLTFARSLGRHDVTVLAGYTEQSSTQRGFFGSGQATPSNDIRVLDASTLAKTTGGNRTNWGLRSLLGRVNYSFAGKYLLTVNVRRDGSSRFAPSNRWGTFPSASVGWRISEEAFMQAVPFLSDLKVRVSYGQVGNQEIGDYQFDASLINTANYLFGGALVTGVTPTSMPAENIRWETSTQQNIGLDLGLFNDQITATVDYFNNETGDMLVRVPVPRITGVGTDPFVNAGSVRNRGLEMALTYRKSAGDFQYSVSGNLTTIRNEVTSLGSGRPIGGGTFPRSGGGASLTRTEVGQPMGYFYGYVTDGIFQDADQINAYNELDGNAATKYQDKAAPGDIRFRDLDNNGVINSLDRTRIGNPFPKLTYGLSGNASYRGFDLTLLLQGVHGNDIYNGIRYWTEGMVNNFNNGTATLNRWRSAEEPGDGRMPRAINGDPNQNRRESDRFIEKGSFLRVKNLSVGYSLPAGLLQRVGNNSLSTVRIYATGQNLLTFTKYTGYDPEIGTFAQPGTANLNLGVDYGNYPQARTLLLGVQVGF